MNVESKLDKALRFLIAHARGARISLTAIPPMGGKLVTRSFRGDQPEEILAFLERHSGIRNLYFSVNPLREAMNKKSKKEDIACVAYCHVDIDPSGEHDRVVERERILKECMAFTPEPTYIIDSGNGYQMFWRLEEPMPNDGDYERLQELNIQVELQLGGDKCHNIDRIMRVPGTINLPTETKLEKGYTEVVTKLVHSSDRTVRAEDFRRLPERFVELAKQDKKVRARFHGDSAGLNDTSRSGFDMSMVALLKSRGLSREETEAVLRLFPYGSYSKTRKERSFERCWDKAAVGELDCHRAVEELNTEFAVLLSGGTPSIIAEWEADDGANDFELLGMSAFRVWMQNRYCSGVDAAGKLKTKELCKVWLGHPLRRQYREIGFWPEGGKPGAYNMWKGFHCEAREGDCSLFLAHLRDNVCRGESELYDYLLAWLAAIIQFPGRKVGTAIVLIGEQGTGKSIVGDVMSRLLGRHHRLVASLRFVTGRFNAHLKDCLLLQCDEAFFAGDHSAAGVLKSLTTSPTLGIEFKGKETIWVDNHVRLLITSNSEWVVPADLEERRFAAFEVGNDRRQDRVYFGAIMDQLDNGGAEALLYYLSKHDYSSVNLNLIPKTAALRTQKSKNLPPEERWLLDVLKRGSLVGDAHGEGRSPGPLLYQDFVDSTNKVGGRHKAYEMEIAQLLKDWIPGLSRPEGSYVLPGSPYEARKRCRVWCFPTLTVCREAFNEKSGEDWEWDDQEDWLAERTDEV